VPSGVYGLGIIMKIYSDDPNVPYKSTEINFMHTKSQIDGLLAEWGVRDSMWHWAPEDADIFIEFKFTEVIEGITVSPVIRVYALLIWDHKKRGKDTEAVNWNISLRLMFWFIKTHMEVAYLTQSSKTAAFLPYIKANEEGEQLHKVVIRNLERIQGMPALPEFPVLERGGS